MAKIVRMVDIAKALDVSTVTVSKALSGQKGVSEEMRDKIKELADQMGYKKTFDNWKKNNSYTIGILVPDNYFGKYDSFYWQIYQELATRAVKKECFTMLEVISNKDESKMELPKVVREKRVDGVIILGRPYDGFVEMLQSESGIPLVCLDFFDKASNSDIVISDGYYGTYMLTNHLFDMGHEDIAYVGTLKYTNSITDRYFGYAKSMLEHGKKIREDFVMDDRDWETGEISTFAMKFPNPMATAFVCNSDLTASIVIKNLNKQGYRVPEDVSVVGFDNYLYPGMSNLEITTYDVNVPEMARISINMLYKKMNGDTKKSSVRTVEGNIVYKDSVAPLKK